MKSFNKKQKYTLQHFFIFLFILIIEEQQNIVNVHKVAFVTTIEPQMGGRSRRRNFQSILLEYDTLFGQRSSFSFLLENIKFVDIGLNRFSCCLEGMFVPLSYTHQTKIEHQHYIYQAVSIDIQQIGILAAEISDNIYRLSEQIYG